MAAVELSARLVDQAIHYIPPVESTPWIIADKDLLYRYRPFYDGPIYSAGASLNNLGLRGEDVSKSKAAKTWRVLCLGDSRTFGFSAGQGHDYPTRMEERLRRHVRGRRLEVINAGRHGYTIYQGLRFLELRGFDLEPDVVTVAFGFNDRRFVLRPEEADNAEWFRKAARRLARRQHPPASYAWLGLEQLLGRDRSEGSWSEAVLALPSQRLDQLHCRVEPEAFRRHLLRLIELCRTRNVPVVVIIMGDAAKAERLFDEGQRQRREGKYAEAIATFRTILDQPKELDYYDWFAPLVHYEIGLTHEAEGQTSAALAAFRQSAQAATLWSIQGGYVVRHVCEYTDVMRSVAAQTKVPTLDLAALFADEPDLFTDFCHYNNQGERRAAEALADCLVKHQLLPRP